MAVGDQVAERRDADEPPVQLSGVCLDREVDVVPLVVLAHGHAVGVDVEPALRAAGAGEDQVDDRARLAATCRGRRAGACRQISVRPSQSSSVGSVNIHSAAQWPIAQTIGVSASPAVVSL